MNNSSIKTEVMSLSTLPICSQMQQSPTVDNITNTIQRTHNLLNGDTNKLISNKIISPTTSAILQTLPNASNIDKKTKDRVDYLQQLLKDKKQCQVYPSVFVHVERLLDEGTGLNFYLNKSIYLNMPCISKDIML